MVGSDKETPIEDTHGKNLPAIFANWFSLTVDSRGWGRLAHGELLHGQLRYDSAVIMSIPDLERMAELITHTLVQAKQQAEMGIVQGRPN